MSEFDRKLKQLAQAEKGEIPDCVHERVNDILEHLSERESGKILRRIPEPVKRIGTCAAAILFAMLVLLPNVSTVYADTLGNIPMLGDLIRVVTVRNYLMDESGVGMDLSIPVIKDDSAGAGHINEDVGSMTAALVEEFCRDLEIGGEKGYGSLHITYDTVLQTDRWFTLRLSAAQTGGGSALTFCYYHIDRASGERVNLGDLFAKEGWRSALEEDLTAQMRAAEAENDDICYWYAPDDTGYEGLKLTEDHDFVITADGDLMIPFDEYEIAPGFMGTPSFTVETEVFAAFLAPQFRDLFS